MEEITNMQVSGEGGFFDWLVPILAEQLRAALQFFDVGYILILFFTAYALIKKTPLKKILSTQGKITVVWILGVVYAVLFYAVRVFILHVEPDPVYYLLSIGISFFSTILLHDGGYEMGLLLWKWVKTWLQNRQNRRNRR